MIAKASSQYTGVSCQLTRRKGCLEPVGGGSVGVVDLQGQGATPYAVVAAAIDHSGRCIRHNHHVMGLTVNHGHVVLVRANPTLEGQGRHIQAQGVLVGPGAALLASRPGEHKVAAAYNAIVARGGVDPGVGWWKGHPVLR